jgi:hypothetical protein
LTVRAVPVAQAATAALVLLVRMLWLDMVATVVQVVLLVTVVMAATLQPRSLQPT